MAGVAIQVPNAFSRVLDLSKIIPHQSPETLEYYTKYGVNADKSVENLAPVLNNVSPSVTLPEGITFTQTYATMGSGSFFAATGMPRQVNYTLMCSFKADAFTPASTTTTRQVAAIWDTSSSQGNSESNTARMSICVQEGSINSGSPRYVTLLWGNNIATTCRIDLDWPNVNGIIHACGSRDAAGNMTLEVRADGQTYKAAGVAPSPLAPAADGTSFRLFNGVFPGRVLNNARLWSVGMWSSTLTAVQINAELDRQIIALS